MLFHLDTRMDSHTNELFEVYFSHTITSVLIVNPEFMSLLTLVSEDIGNEPVFFFYTSSSVSF